MSVQVALYYGGEMKTSGPNGVYYNQTPKRMMLFQSNISYSEMLSRVCSRLGLDQTSVKLELVCRYPVHDGKAGIQYTSCPVNDDEDVEVALTIPLRFPEHTLVELYVCLRDRMSLPVNNGSTPMGDRQILSGGLDSEGGQNGAMLDGQIVGGGSSYVPPTVNHTYEDLLESVDSDDDDDEYAPEVESESCSDKDDALEPEDFVYDKDDMCPIPEVGERASILKDGMYDFTEPRKSLTNVDNSYRKTGHGQTNAFKKVYDDWDESYKELPRLMAAIEIANPGTIVRWKHDREQSTGEFKVFGSVFWTFKPCIDAFRHCRPVISIYGTQICGKYKESMLVVVAIDAADNVFPLAFSIVDEESKENWGWFLRSIRGFVLKDMLNICLVSDENAAILAAIEADRTWQPPFVHNRFCIKHLNANFINKFHSSTLGSQMWSAATVRGECNFFARMNQLKDSNAEAYNWLMWIGVEKWTLSCDGGRRYMVGGNIASEMLNGMLNDARHIPITACVQSIFQRMNTIFERNRQQAQTYVMNNIQWPESVQKHCCFNESDALRHTVTSYDRTKGLFEVVTASQKMEGGVVCTVSLNEKTCTCGYFQLCHMPCGHAIKACDHIHTVARGLIADCYTSCSMLHTYNSHFVPLQHPICWPPAQFLLLPNPVRRNSGPGRP